MILLSPALGDRSLFPSLAPRYYLNHGGISPLSQPVVEAAQHVFEDFSIHGAAAFERCLTQVERVRTLAARLIGATAEDIAITPNTTQGISEIALNFRWNQGDRILLFDGEFPSNIIPWQQAALLHQLQITRLSLTPFHRSHEEGIALLERELKTGVRMVAVSAVQFQTGLRMPIAAMAERCHHYGARLLVDGVQAVGAVPLAVQHDGVDFLAAGSHKWMMGATGAGILYVSPEAVEELNTWTAGWLSTTEAVRFLSEGEGHLRYDRPMLRSVRKLEGGNWNTAGVAALEASLGLIGTLGIPSIYQHINAYLDLLEIGLLERGFSSERSSNPAARSTNLAVRPPGAHPLSFWVAALAERGVACATPDGRLRLTPHWPNALSEVPSVLAIFDEVLSLA